MKYCAIDGCFERSRKEKRCLIHWREFCVANGIHCVVAGCSKAPFARKMCSTHYGRWMRTGTTDLTRPSVEDRFLAQVDKDGPNGCWIWTGRLFKGYGTFSIQRAPRQQTNIGAHRWAYTHWVGPIPDGLVVCHHCDTPPCVNPDHLFVGTHQDNAIDRERKGRGAQLRGTQQRTAVLDDDMVRLIRRLHRPGKVGTYRLSALLGIHPSTIGNVLYGDGWKHVS